MFVRYGWGCESPLLGATTILNWHSTWPDNKPPEPPKKANSISGARSFAHILPPRVEGAFTHSPL